MYSFIHNIPAIVFPNVPDKRSSCFGLGAAVFTRDESNGENIAAQELQASCSCVNDFVKSDPRLPFSAIEESGYSRELADFGILEFVNIKTVYVK